MTLPDGVDTPREAEVTTTDEHPSGACLYLTPDELRALGVDPEEADSLTYTVDEETGSIAVETTEVEES